MSAPTFYIVDVFAEEKYAGNQLAVVRGAADHPRRDPAKIAAEMNYSETMFTVSEEERAGSYDVRIFTPREEIPFAGHPTLGIAFVIAHEVAAERPQHVTLNLKAGRVFVDLGDVPWMRQLPPTFGEALDPSRIVQVLGLEEVDLDERYPIQQVSTGLPAIIVPLRSLDTLKRCRVDKERYFALVEDREAKNIYAFCPEAHEEADLAARMFADYHRVPKDPATQRRRLPRRIPRRASILRHGDRGRPGRAGVRDRSSLAAISESGEGERRDKRLRRRKGADGGERGASLSGKMPTVQRTVANFVEAHGLEAPVETRLLDLISEVGELSKEVLKGTEYGRRDLAPPEGWAGELADVLFALVCLANSTEVDLETALNEALEKYEERLVSKGDAGSGR